MYTRYIPTPFVLLLPAFHLALCFMLSLGSSEGSWRYFPLFVVDFPASFVFVRLGFLTPMLVFILFGTLWWYLISLFIRLAFRGATRSSRS